MPGILVFFAALLQWGRNLSVAEGARLAHGIDGLIELQWGRNLSVAEGADYLQACIFGVASMGPQPFGCGRQVQEAKDVGAAEASMGPQPFGCGRNVLTWEVRNAIALQWGRNLSVAEGALDG